MDHGCFIAHIASSGISRGSFRIQGHCKLDTRGYRNWNTGWQDTHVYRQVNTACTDCNIDTMLSSHMKHLEII